MHTDLETITPDMAKAILSTQSPDLNRNINRAHVTQMARDMRAGAWVVNGETIKFSGSRVLDGQHRLAAVVESGCSIQVLVVRGLPPGVFDTIDSGRKRKLGDVLHIRGYKNSMVIAAAVTHLWHYRRGTLGGTHAYPSHQEAEELLRNEPGIINSVSYGRMLNAIMAPGYAICLHYLFASNDTALADRYYGVLASGQAATVNDPAYIVRERLIANRLSKARLPHLHEAVFVIKGWNALRSGQTIKIMRWKSSEEVPDIL